MKTMNSLETQLASWTPRRPRRGIERRLFGGPAPSSGWPVLASVVGPAVACLVLTWAGWRQSEGWGFSGENPQAAQLALSLSNQSFAPYLPGNGQSPANRLDTFEWTNRGDSRSSVPSFPPPKAVKGI